MAKTWTIDRPAGEEVSDAVLSELAFEVFQSYSGLEHQHENWELFDEVLGFVAGAGFTDGEVVDLEELTDQFADFYDEEEN